VSYLREAWESDSQGLVRVTLDRGIKGTLHDGAGKLAIPTRGVRAELPYFPPDAVVLELKFSHGCPAWISKMVQAFDLQRRPVSKYCACIEATGLHRGLRHSGRPEEETLL
jgi:hypothetical protein